MSKYPLTCLDCRLPDGQVFTVTVCGYSGKIRHLAVGKDDLRYLRAGEVEITDLNCKAGEHCLAFSCSLNRTGPSHLAHMLEMPTDEELDDETAGLVGTRSSVEALVKFAERMNEVIPEELRKKKVPRKSRGNKLKDEKITGKSLVHTPNRSVPATKKKTGKN